MEASQSINVVLPMAVRVPRLVFEIKCEDDENHNALVGLPVQRAELDEAPLIQIFERLAFVDAPLETSGNGI